MSISVLAVADAVSPLLYDYFCPDRWDQVDLVLSAGDLPPDYLDFLCTSLNVPVYYVRGNHDSSFPSSAYDGCENIHGRIVDFKGLRIAGFEGCRRYNQGSFQYSEQEMRRVVKRTRFQILAHGTPHVILSHAPPAGCHDSSDVCHRGFDCFRAAIDDWQPVHFIHGHVHSYNRGPTVSQLGGTTVVNAYPYQLLQLEQPLVSSAPLWRRLRPRAGPSPSAHKGPARTRPAGPGLTMP